MSHEVPVLILKEEWGKRLLISWQVGGARALGRRTLSPRIQGLGQSRDGSAPPPQVARPDSTCHSHSWVAQEGQCPSHPLNPHLPF